MKLPAFLFLLLFPLALDGEHAILERHFHVLLPDGRQVRFHEILAVRFPHIQRRHPVSEEIAFLSRPPTCRLTEKAIQPAVHVLQLPKWIPIERCSSHTDSSESGLL
jgi:hypothetical protein